MSVEEILATFFINHDNLTKLSKKLHNDLSNIDRELSNFYHKVEGIHLSHNTQGHKLVVELQDILVRRRIIKKETILIRSFLDSTSTSINNAKNRNKLSLDRHNKLMESIEDRIKLKK